MANSAIRPDSTEERQPTQSASPNAALRVALVMAVALMALGALGAVHFAPSGSQFYCSVAFAALGLAVFAVSTAALARTYCQQKKQTQQSDSQQAEEVAMDQARTEDTETQPPVEVTAASPKPEAREKAESKVHRRTRSKSPSGDTDDEGSSIVWPSQGVVSDYDSNLEGVKCGRRQIRIVDLDLPAEQADLDFHRQQLLLNGQRLMTDEEKKSFREVLARTPALKPFTCQSIVAEVLKPLVEIFQILNDDGAGGYMVDTGRGIIVNLVKNEAGEDMAEVIFLGRLVSLGDEVSPLYDLTAKLLVNPKLPFAQMEWKVADSAADDDTPRRFTVRMQVDGNWYQASHALEKQSMR